MSHFLFKWNYVGPAHLKNTNVWNARNSLSSHTKWKIFIITLVSSQSQIVCVQLKAQMRKFLNNSPKGLHNFNGFNGEPFRTHTKCQCVSPIISCLTRSRWRWGREIFVGRQRGRLTQMKCFSKTDRVLGIWPKFGQLRLCEIKFLTKRKINDLALKGRRNLAER